MTERPHDVLARELVSLVRRLRDLHAAVAEAGGLRVEASLVPVLGRVAEEQPLRLSLLAARLRLDLSTVSRQVAQLERRGWLERRPDPEDRRAVLVRLTADGTRVNDELQRGRGELLARLLPDWDDEDLRAFAAYAARFTSAVTASSDLVAGGSAPAREAS